VSFYRQHTEPDAAAQAGASAVSVAFPAGDATVNKFTPPDFSCGKLFPSGPRAHLLREVTA